jgi:hypothetical protein
LRKPCKYCVCWFLHRGIPGSARELRRKNHWERAISF